MTLNGAITELVRLTQHPMMPSIFIPSLDKVIETISECEEPSETPHWISVEDYMPDEHESIFAKYYGTNKWNDSMFINRSDNVLVVEVYEDGSKKVGVAHTCDGEWRYDIPIIKRKIIYWMKKPSY